MNANKLTEDKKIYKGMIRNIKLEKIQIYLYQNQNIS
jgi:hypothetical protein